MSDSDHRRPKCGDYVMAHVPVMPKAEFERLDEEARTQKCEAKRAGCSHVSARAPPKRSMKRASPVVRSLASSGLNRGQTTVAGGDDTRSA